MNEERIQQIKDQLRNLMQQITEMGEEPPEEIQDLLLQVIQRSQQKIQALRQEEQGQSSVDSLPPTQANIENIQEAMPSSNVEGFAYDDKSGKLLVRFLGDHPNRNGPVYSYSGVPREIFDMFQKGAVPARTNGQNKWGKWWKGKVPSIGASLYTLIKSRGYPYQKIA